MSSKATLILAIIWLILSPLCFLTENTMMGIIWLCGGISEIIIGLIQRNKEKNR